MPERRELVLEGCAPVPLAGYLKALGVFRLVAEQLDEDVAGFWRDERFVLRTNKTLEEVVDFFVNTYAPSPILSPWNAGSGFYYREGKTKERDAAGKKLKTGVRDEPTTATKTLDLIAASPAKRFAPLGEAARAAKDALKAGGHIQAPSDDGKSALIAEARGSLSDAAARWIDATATLARGGLEFPPLLGSGGNDGNLDFSTTLFQALLSLFDAQTGAPLEGAQARFEASVLGEARPSSTSGAISQFAAGASGGLNTSVGFDGGSSGNLWDVVLGIEGALMLSSTAARRLGANEQAGGAFPFMTPRGGALAAGAGSVGLGDEGTARGEFWAPLWSRPVGLDELAGLFREGRAVVKRRGARNSLDFARAVEQLGTSRGLEQFDRHAFEQRNGNMYVGVALPRRSVPPKPSVDLIADLDEGGWLRSIQQAVRGKTASAGFANAGRQLDDALFRLAGDASPEAVQEALIAIGRIALECAKRPALRAKSDRGRPPTTPPPRLSADWRAKADDGNAEFALAAALAGLDAETGPERDAVRMPFRAHLAPLAVGWGKGADGWSETTAAQALAVWTGRDPLRDIAAVLERRLVEAQRHPFVRGGKAPGLELPLRGYPGAPLWAVAAFLAHRTDDDRIGTLTAGLAWVRSHAEKDSPAGEPREAPSPNLREDGLPFAFAALKPLFDPAGVAVGEERRKLDPLPLVRLVTAERVPDAVAFGQRLARGAGLPAAFAKTGRRTDFDARRLAAALAFPLSQRAYERLVERAYPDLSKDRPSTEPAHAAQP